MTEYDIVAYPQCPVSSSIFKNLESASHSYKANLQHTQVNSVNPSSVQAISQS